MHLAQFKNLPLLEPDEPRRVVCDWISEREYAAPFAVEQDANRKGELVTGSQWVMAIEILHRHCILNWLETQRCL